MSRGELTSVKNAVGLEALCDPKSRDYALLQYLAYDEDRFEKLLEMPELLRTPIVRNGKKQPSAIAPKSGRLGNES